MLVAEEDFNIFGWSATIPLADEDLWLGMQARNIAVVDMSIIRSMESEALEAYMERERTPSDILMVLSALSQMWVFSLYEFLRTWRQRADEILKVASEYELLPSEEREAYIRRAVQHARKREQLIRSGLAFASLQIEKIPDKDFVESVRNYHVATENGFRDAEALRVTLAKHEVPRTNKFVAEAPGYGRMEYRDGSMYWFITLKDGSQFKVNRRVLADAFLDIDPGA